MPDNYGRSPASEMPESMQAFLYPKCNYVPPRRQVPYFCPQCGLLGAHSARAQEAE